MFLRGERAWWIQYGHCGRSDRSSAVQWADGTVMSSDRISIDPQICHGQACVRGTRIPVHQLVRMLANGDTVEDLLVEFPSLTREDIMASLDYAADLTEEQVTPIESLG